jgi:hypothetical protein
MADQMLQMTVLVSKMRTATGAFCRPIRAVAAALVIVLFALAALAASPALHKAIHADADSGSHHCAVSVLAQGHVELPAGSTSFCLAFVEWDYAPPFLVSVWSRAVELLPPGRGPPTAFSI